MDNNAEAEFGLERFRQYLLLFARLHMSEEFRCKFDPSDVVQQTLLEAHRKQSQFRGSNEAELAVWLRQMLACEIADTLRGFRRAKRNVALERTIGQAFLDSSSRLEQMLAAGHSSPSDQAVKNEQLIRLAEAMSLLPEDQRRAVELKHLQGKTVAAISVLLGRSETAVGGLLRRGMTKLRELLSSNSSE